MTVHLIKLCVGADSVEDLVEWIAEVLADKARRGLPAEQVHTTRMMPRRRSELLDGGSLYWVVRGVIQCRQRLLDVRPTVGQDGVSRCELVLDPQVVPVEPRPRGPFQGWRYYEPKDAPPDLDPGGTADLAAMPAQMRRELTALGLL